MMRLIASVLFLLVMGNAFGQDNPEEKEVKKAIETFFQGFHARDSVLMKSVLADAVVVQTIGRTQSGEPSLHQEEIQKVLRGIVSIPLETEFLETIHRYDIRVDGLMANAWTPYSFHLNGKLSHCGVNNFQLFKDQGKWKIIYLIDTRRRQGCEL